jgi:DNA-binding response OmpR family regulator
VSVVPHGFRPHDLPAPPRILVVDDSEPTARALAALLGGANYHAVTALRGADALDRAAEHDFAAAIVDVHLPDINGLLVTQKLRAAFGADVPIIVLSGDTSMQTLNRLPDAGATYFFSKPVNSAQLLERLRELVSVAS